MREDGIDTMVKDSRGMNEEHGDVISYSTMTAVYKFCATCGTGLRGQHTSDATPLINVCASSGR